MRGAETLEKNEKEYNRELSRLKETLFVSDRGFHKQDS